MRNYDWHSVYLSALFGIQVMVNVQSLGIYKPPGDIFNITAQDVCVPG
jgi:hypothetical protein